MSTPPYIRTTIMVIWQLASTWLRGQVTACSETNEPCIVQSYYVNAYTTSTIVHQTSTSENEHLQPSPKVCQIKDRGPQAPESQEDNARRSGMPPLPASMGDITTSTSNKGITSEKDNTNKRRTDRGRDGSEADLRHKNNTGEAPVTIDEPSSRAQRPLPKRTTTMPEPNPATHVHDPTHTEEYLYMKLTRSGEDALEMRPNRFDTLFSKFTFPCSYTPTPLLLKNVTTAQRERIEKLSDSILAIIPYLAGPRWEAKYQSKAIPTLELFLKGINFPERGKINLTMSIPKSTQARQDFGRPWVIILDGISAAFWAWLLDLGLISLTEPGATFFVKSFADNKMSWKLIDHVLDDLTSSWRLVFIRCNNKVGDPDSRLQLQGHPISIDISVQREWLKAVRSITVYVGFKQLKPDNRELGCIGCKAETHPSWACPYPTENADHWLGPTADEYNKVLKNPLDWKQDRRANIDGPSSSNNHEFTPIPDHY
ncbi:hypothetical protein EV368DRAFT_82498 [Lentinula lateritia]|nr:hypothetical protein EV368DRAFT_82498 [Lentinula lateritia]